MPARHDMAVKEKSLTRESWIEAARRVLVNGGVEDVKVDRIARRLRMTRGSFYWHFSSREDLLNALLKDWEARNLTEIAQVEMRSVESEADLAAVIRIWIGEDPGFPAFDMAVRFWGRKSSKVASVVRRTDDAWVAQLQKVVGQLGYDSTESFVRARVIYFHQIGYYALGIEEDIERRLELAPYYYRVLTGKAPTPAAIREMTASRAIATPAAKTPRRSSNSPK
jgi:AcrR family transcriptional regulator